MSTLDNFEQHLQFLAERQVEHIHPAVPVAKIKKDLKEYIKEKHQKQSGKKRIEVDSKHYKELILAVHDLHKKLVKRKSPYRFCIYLENDEVVIDFLILDENGKPLKTLKKDITHDDFIRWFEDLESGRGILFDQKA